MTLHTIPAATPNAATAAATANVSPAYRAKAHAAAEDFEAVFLHSMMQQMFTGIGDEGPLGGGQATGVWRSMLTDQYARSFAKSGGIGIAAQVYDTLIAAQAGHASSQHVSG
jgi:Rod binding domain-containing protein